MFAVIRVYVLYLFVELCFGLSTDSNSGIFKNAAVATNAKQCAAIGTDILRKNGSAVEAAIAALFCEGVMSMESMGLGGGFIMTIFKKDTGKVYSLISRETAPAAATEDMFHGNSSKAEDGGLAVGVPGELKGYEALFNNPDFRSGNIEWKDLIEPTIQICEQGIEVSSLMFDALAATEEIISETESLREILINNATGRVWNIGDSIKRPKLAETLRVIANEGASALYNGSLTKGFVQDVQSLNGIITEEDLANYEPRWLDPVTAKLRDDITMYTSPLPGSGVILTFILNILSDFVPADTDVITYQRIVESFKYAYGRRTHLGDNFFVHNIDDLLTNLTSPKYAEFIRAQIYDNETWNDPEHYGGDAAQPEDHGTGHVSVLAPNGDAVAVTSTINTFFGAKIRSKSTGIILNDQMDDFSSPNITNAFGVPPSPNNYIVPGKRPVSSMVPTIFVDAKGDVRLIVGCAGGTKITTTVALVAMRNLWFNETLNDAVNNKRIHHQLYPMNIEYEDGFSENYLQGLEEIGHSVSPYYNISGSTVTAISKEGDSIYANSDYRRGGLVSGF